MFSRFYNRMFPAPNHRVVAKQELELAQLELLQAQAHKEHWQARESMLKSRIERLEKVHSSQLVARN
jgi:hypothetical protein